MRTTKKERKENAKNFYNTFMNSNCNQAAIVVERTESSNPNIIRCRFIAVPSTLAFMENPIVIAESVSGITGCFMELLDDIKPRRGTEKKHILTMVLTIGLKKRISSELHIRTDLYLCLKKIVKKYSNQLF